MTEIYGKRLYERPVTDVTKKRKKYLGIGIFIGFLGTLIFLIYVPTIPAFQNLWTDSIIYSFILWLIGLFGGHMLSVEYNQFGIYENGFSPPRRPRKIFGRAKRYFIPYKDIEKIDIEGKSFPRAPFFFTITLMNGVVVEFDVGDFIAYIGNDNIELKKIFEMLMEISRQIEEKKNIGSGLVTIDDEPLNVIIE